VGRLEAITLQSSSVASCCITRPRGVPAGAGNLKPGPVLRSAMSQWTIMAIWSDGPELSPFAFCPHYASEIVAAHNAHACAPDTPTVAAEDIRHGRAAAHG
jgi:hypothetical protein